MLKLLYSDWLIHSRSNFFIWKKHKICSCSWADIRNWIILSIFQQRLKDLSSLSCWQRRFKPIFETQQLGKVAINYIKIHPIYRKIKHVIWFLGAEIVMSANLMHLLAKLNSWTCQKLSYCSATKIKTLKISFIFSSYLFSFLQSASPPPNPPLLSLQQKNSNFQWKKINML